ncbi:AEC family transporter [uncultured Methanosphaera sp.]|uniref:AEC family transporter n=1 Tax=uncultured Methanosphaera sp. TaxID=262501 RepID=UPI002594FDB2|nr:AEC family transporter [uncultured Methanosphaera sp.]
MVNPIEIILIPTIMIIIGYALKRNNVLNAKDSTTLSKIVINISLPSLIFVNLSSAHINSNMAILPVASFAVSMVCMLLAYLFSRSRGYSKIKTWTLMIAAAMMNSGFIGFPITLGVFGNEGFLNAIFYDLATTVLFVMFGMILVGEFGGDKKDVVKNGLKFVPLWAVILGLLFNFSHIEMGYVLKNVFTYLGNSTTPLIMLSLGLTIDFREIKHYLKDSLLISLLRLVVSPLLMFGILSAIHLTGLAFNVAVLEAGMSTAMNALVLSITYNLDNKLMSSCIFTDVLLSLVTLTVIITFVV